MTEGERFPSETRRIPPVERGNSSAWIVVAILVIVGLALMVWAFSGNTNTGPATGTSVETPATTPAPSVTPPADTSAGQPLNNETAPAQPSPPAATAPATPQPAPAPAPAQ
jgi:hypothetical protein